MKLFLDSRLVKPVIAGLGSCIHHVQHIVMKAAVAVSLKLCLFTARLLLDSSARNRAGQSF